jgi:acetylornithine deacetylase
MGLERSLVNAIEKESERLTELLRTLIQFPSENPPGNEAPAQRWMASKLQELDAEVDIFDVLPGRPDVVGVLRGGGAGRSLILNGHIDVVEARQPESWKHDPFAGVVEGNVLFGRGASDMKSALAAYVFVLGILKEQGIRLRGDVIVQCVVGEEAAEPGTKAAAERYRADFAIVGEGTRARGLVASVGALTARITITSPYTLHLHARRQILHAGGGLEGANAIEKMALHIVPALNELEREWAVFKKHWAIPPGQTMINPFLIQGGTHAGYLPDECTMYVTVVYLPGEKPREVQQEIEEQLRRSSELDSWLRCYPPKIDWNPPEQPWVFPSSELDQDSDGVRVLGDVIQELAQGEVEYGGRGAITDAGWLRRTGTPTVVYGPGDVYWAHRVDERVNLDDVLLYAKVLAVFLLRWCDVVD